MSDDLVKRLSFLADRIELGDRLRWGEDSAALRDAKDRIEELEAKLRNAEWRFEHLKKYGDTNEARDFAADALAELTGGKDE